MGFISTVLGEMWAKHLLTSKTPKYGKDSKLTFAQYVDSANKRIEGYQKEMSDLDNQMADNLYKSIGELFAVVKADCHGDEAEAWKMWSCIRWIEAKYGVDRWTAYQTVRNQVKEGKCMDAAKCEVEVREMIARGENTIYGDEAE